MTYRGRAIVLGAAAMAALGAAGESRAVTFQNLDDYNSQLAAPLYSGVGRLVFRQQDGTLDHGCTAALVARNVILTAAHCLSADSSYRFLLPDTGRAGQAMRVLGLKQSYALPSYTGIGTSDMAVVTLDANVYGRDVYGLYDTIDELGQEVTIVGGGSSGLLSEGASFGLSDSQLRYGVNRYEADATVFGYNADIAMFDYDNGLDENDVFGRYLGIRDTGVRVDGKVVDVGIIYGDSGGPDFIGNRIAGVHSFAGSGSFFTTPSGDRCGNPGDVDPVPMGALGTCSDGSYGDLGGSVRVSFYHDQIRSYVASAEVPEPATWALMVAGFGAIGGVMRRRARRPALA